MFVPASAESVQKFPFIIYTPERTGSTTLTRLLNCHPDIRCKFEPFNASFLGPSTYLCNTLLQSKGIQAAVESLWSYSNCNGFKHVWHTNGWPFVGQPELNHWLLQHASASIILLGRRNLLRRAISGQISAQMHMWVPRNEADRQHVRNHDYAPLDIAALREEIQREKAEHEKVRQIVLSTRKPWIEITYEDLFAPARSIEARLQVVQNLFTFLGLYNITDSQRLQNMRWLFDPANTGFQNASAYGRISNIQKVESELGSDEHGRVFEPRLSTTTTRP